MPKSRTYDESLDALLRKPRDAAAYLNAALAEEDASVFLLALRDVARVHGGIRRLADSARLNRESLYRMLSENGNPTVSSLSALLHSMGLRLAVTPSARNRS